MQQQEKPDDYVIATGQTHSVHEFCEATFREVGIDLKWVSTGVEEKGIDATTNQVVIEVDPHYFRPTEVEALVGDASKAKLLRCKKCTRLADHLYECLYL